MKCIFSLNHFEECSSLQLSVLGILKSWTLRYQELEKMENGVRQQNQMVFLLWNERNFQMVHFHHPFWSQCIFPRYTCINLKPLKCYHSSCWQYSTNIIYKQCIFITTTVVYTVHQWLSSLLFFKLFMSWKQVTILQQHQHIKMVLSYLLHRRPCALTTTLYVFFQTVL